MDKKETTYEIDGRIYIQRPLVLGQIDQLIDLAKDLDLPPDFSPIEIKRALGERFYDALAIVLIPISDVDGLNIPKILKSKDIPALAEELRWSTSHEMGLEVIEDFFDYNPVASIFERLTALAKRINEKVVSPISKAGSKSLS